jgi:hypothetical protein
MTSRQDLTRLRQRLYECTELRAEAIPEQARREWLVDVFADENDPVYEIIEKLTWNQAGATALGLAGGTGVGKTTQIYRLIDVLWTNAKIIGIRVGYEDYSSLSSPPDITDFLLSTIGGLADTARTLGHLPRNWSDKSIDDRIVALLRRLRFDLEISTGPIKIKAALREDDSFRRRLRDHLSGQVAQLVREVRNFADEIVAAIHERKPTCRGVAMIVDSTERLSAPASADEAMQSAVRNLYIQNGENLQFDKLHSVYLLPPWLPISDGGALRLDTVTFPSIRVADRDGNDAMNGITLLDSIVRKRMPDINTLINDVDLVELYRMSGGVQRVLFLLLKEVAGRARRATSLPIEDEIVRTAVDSVRQDYLAISIEAAPALDRIDRTKSVDGLEQEILSEIGRYFQALVVLQVANGEKWFTVHPLMRKRLDAIRTLI